MAPDFTLRDSSGERHTLSDYRGSLVVLEWVNHGCPCVKKFYDPGYMQAWQEDFTARGVVWLTINSSAPGRHGYLTVEEANLALEEKNASPTAFLMDPDGDVAGAFDARATPQIIVIDREGRIIYNGAVDSDPTTHGRDMAEAENYLLMALEAALDDRPVAVSRTRPYGCAISYAF